MTSQVDEQAFVVFKHRVYGGTPSSVGWLAPKVGPLGISPRLVCQAIQDKTRAWENYKVDVCVRVNRKKRSFEVEVTPSVSTMLLRASSYIPPDVSDRNLIARSLGKGGYEVKTRTPEERKKKFSHDADITKAAVFAIAKQQRVWGRSQAVTAVGTIKEVLGSCHSLGITVDGVRAIKLQQAITEGRFALPADPTGEVIETFLDEETGEPRPHLLKEITTMTDEDRTAAKQRSTAKMVALRHRDPLPLPDT